MSYFDMNNETKDFERIRLKLQKDNEISFNDLELIADELVIQYYNSTAPDNPIIVNRDRAYISVDVDNHKIYVRYNFIRVTHKDDKYQTLWSLRRVNLDGFVEWFSINR